ncbi:peptide ABC transporter substrate-binding protein [Anaeromicropila herbilytica]|uniref:Peptide ABC transporter substrate-binding protein n=1 Tax=Anaeromicropila herbilytica TaxID=2785025 RepID=A0A7R7EPC8_9FIRM|nr:peptide ABC transporter substrate-binding protein [Anaeromicropila herbilytica]BCN32576.1 peptide ABC transporter substrate-binding protein [Anaeromicropila herbilytica]
MNKVIFKKPTAILLLVVMVISTALAGCAKKDTTKNNANTGANGEFDLNVQVGPEPGTIDPSLNTTVDGATLINHAFEGLMKINDKGEVVNGQAASYTVSKDNLVYTFKIRDDAKWSDGKPVTANDFVYSWRRAVNPATGSEYNYMIEMVKNASDIMAGKKDPSELGVKAVDDKTFEVTLTSPTTYFIEIAAFPTTYPLREDVVSKNPDTWATDPKTYVGNGPYVLDSWDHQAKMVYVQNKNYYDVDKLGPDKINFVLMDDQNTILSAFKNGDILFGDDLPSEEIAAMKDKGLYIVGQLGTYFLCINTSKKEFSDPKVRQALSLALDRQYLVDNVAKGGQQPADTFVATGLADADANKQFHDTATPWYDLKDYKGNIEKAKKLLAESGYPNGKGFPSIELSTNPGHEAIMEAVQNMWTENLGLNVTITSEDWNVFVETRKSGNYQIARHGWLADYNDPISFLDMWVTGGGNNDAKWSNKDYDALIKTVKTSTDRNERYTAMHKAEDILAKEMPIIPIYYYTDLYLKSDKLQGFYSSPLGFKYFMYTSLSK